MTVQPGRVVLPKHKTHEAMATVAEDQDKGPGSAQLAALRIPHQSGIPKINLSLLPSWRVQAHGHRPLQWLDVAAYVTMYAHVADSQLVILLKQPLHLSNRHVRLTPANLQSAGGRAGPAPARAAQRPPGSPPT